MVIFFLKGKSICNGNFWYMFLAWQVSSSCGIHHITFRRRFWRAALKNANKKCIAWNQFLFTSDVFRRRIKEAFHWAQHYSMFLLLKFRFNLMTMGKKKECCWSWERRTLVLKLFSRMMLLIWLRNIADVKGVTIKHLISSLYYYYYIWKIGYTILFLPHYAKVLWVRLRWSPVIDFGGAKTQVNRHGPDWNKFFPSANNDRKN